MFKDNLLFDDDMTFESVHSEMPYNVGSVATLGGYHCLRILYCVMTDFQRMEISSVKRIVHLLERVALR